MTVMTIFNIFTGLVSSTILPLFFYFGRDRVNRQDKILEQPTSREFVDFVENERVRRQIEVITGVSLSVAQPIIVSILDKFKYELASAKFFKPVNVFLSVDQSNNQLSINHQKVKKHHRTVIWLGAAIIILAIFLSIAVVIKSWVGVSVFALYIAGLLIAAIVIAPPSDKIISAKENVIKRYYNENN
ncbi:MAG TPA: hypothetical protein DD649_18745 [Providencia sp.]|uniref:hypothetical protein n=1 Tax=Providencia sp. TaxID=589 RepID=UPI000E99B435|nr:hypothetical protein [Providencia sp.]HBO24900.1 hypothetical protein [Providencia sp.]